MGRPAAHRWRRVAGALAVSSVLIGVVAAWIAAHGDPVRGAAFALLGWASAAAVGTLGRRAPGPAVIVAGSLSITGATLNPIPPFVLLPFAVGVVVATTAGAAVWAVSAVGAAWAVALVIVFVSTDPYAARGLGATFVLVLALGAGGFLRARQVRRDEDARRAADRQRTAIEEERLRIARELHDVLAHSLSSITVQAGVGLHLAAERPSAATEALETIRAASREALEEVRGVLGVLRGEERAPLAPGPGLDELGTLVEETRRTGARVELEDALQPRPSTAVQLAVYRVVQEALTNARRHAPGAAVTIALAREPGVVIASVRDRLSGAPAPAPLVPGNGITGMRERAASLGGELALVPHEDGLEVRLRIPVPEGPA